IGDFLTRSWADGSESAETISQRPLAAFDTSIVSVVRRAAVPSLEEELLIVTALRSGADSAIRIVRLHRARTPGEQPYRTRFVSRAARDLLAQGQAREALKLYELNAAVYPDRTDSYDNLADA